MRLTIWLASGAGSHLLEGTDAARTRASIGVTPDIFRTADQRHASFAPYYGVFTAEATEAAEWRPALPAYQTSRGREGEASPASRTASIPVRKMPSNVPA